MILTFAKSNLFSRSARSSRKMTEPYNNQRDKKQSNQSDETNKLKNIEILNTDCLEHIFKLLPMVDLFKIQRGMQS